MPIVDIDEAAGYWNPSPLAAGPFVGLQGGVVAGLLTAEVERLASVRGWGTAVSSAAWFLRPTPMARLRSEVTVFREGGRVSVVDNALWGEGEREPFAAVRVTLIQDRALEVPGFVPKNATATNPEEYPERSVPAPHGGKWFMDATEVRLGTDTAWFRLKDVIVEGAGPLAQVMGPADWAHGLFRPVHRVVADPNPNLTVHLTRRPQGDWIGVRSHANWEPARGVGLGLGTLLDVAGEIGVVSMAVALTPLSKLTVPKSS